jgi:outer membrane protein OmpA-like peptidoglycan-associated protein
MNHRVLILTAMIFGTLAPLRAQFDRSGLGGGFGVGAMWGHTDSRDRIGQIQGRGYLRYQFNEAFTFDVGAAIGKIKGEGFETQAIPFDARLLLSPFSTSTWRPFIYGGIGMANFKHITPAYIGAEEKPDFWTMVIPVGAGLQFPITDNAYLELSGGLNLTGSDSVNALVVNDRDDYFWTGLVGLTVTPGGDPDPDRDGLTNDQEDQLGTDPNVADTDGDGLNDGDEVNRHKTSPLKADSDGDGLTDGDEVLKHRTDPNKPDTDGDGLSDGDEVNKHKTDALKADTDGDGLNDGDEVTKHATDPLKADTDGEGLSDGDEVNKYKTDPLKADTDAGTVDDGTEVGRGTDPLAAADDLKKEEFKVEVGKSIVLEGITFAVAKADITPESEQTLEKAYNTLAQNPEIAVEIQGHTDNTGRRGFNMRLSNQRAESVKSWLVAKGIDPSRIATAGFGPDKPIAPNATPEGRTQNRRIEFLRTK